MAIGSKRFLIVVLFLCASADCFINQRQRISASLKHVVKAGSARKPGQTDKVVHHVRSIIPSMHNRINGSPWKVSPPKQNHMIIGTNFSPIRSHHESHSTHPAALAKLFASFAKAHLSQQKGKTTQVIPAPTPANTELPDYELGP